MQSTFSVIKKLKQRFNTIYSWNLPGEAGPGLFVSESLDGNLGKIFRKAFDFFSSDLMLLGVDTVTV